MVVERETKSPREYKTKLAQRKRRYNSDPKFRERLQRFEREYRLRRKRGEVKDPVVAKKWRLTRLEHQIEDTAEELRDHKISDLMPLSIPGETKQRQVYISPKGYLCLRPGIKAEFVIDTQNALDFYKFGPVSEALKGVSQSLGLKK